MNAITTVLSFFAGLTTPKEEKGATAVEYALVVGLVSLIVVAAVALFGPAIEDFVGNINFGGNSTP